LALARIRQLEGGASISTRAPPAGVLVANLAHTSRKMMTAPTTAGAVYAGSPPVAIPVAVPVAVPVAAPVAAPVAVAIPPAVVAGAPSIRQAETPRKDDNGLALKAVACTGVLVLFTVIALGVLLSGKCMAGSECNAAVGMITCVFLGVPLTIAHLVVGISWMRTRACCFGAGQGACCACCCDNPPRAMVVLAALSMLLNLAGMGIGAGGLGYETGQMTGGWVLVFFCWLANVASLGLSVFCYNAYSAEKARSQGPSGTAV